ncbi:hypothetical protein ACQ9BO_15120 [Flavobacterium sp. P21]|uniref:hypothetical protein n=1 Tax=Flavobacterium sp. P21 TaxID=3423948 RepID=UPI003D670DF1
MENTIAIYGAYGHTGKFIVAELYRQGYRNLILAGRDSEKLVALLPFFPDSEIRVANIDDPKSLDEAFKDTKIIINSRWSIFGYFGAHN